MALKNREFLELARDAALAALVEGEPPHCRLRGSLLQLHFGAPEQHYEVWLRPQAGLVELGLHFEGDRDDNRRRVAAVAEAMPVIAAALGSRVEVEEWTESWTRAHETLPLRALDQEFARELGLRIARYIQVLEPVVRPLGAIRPATTKDRGRLWGARRRRARGAARPGDAS